MIPPAPKNTRQITEHIKTVWDPRGKTVRAEYHGAANETSPYDKECCALQDLIWQLEEAGISSVVLASAQAICDEMDARIEARPDGAIPRLKEPEAWLVEPFPRGPKPRRLRFDWIDPATGKKVRIYKDTLQRYAHLPPRTPESESDHTHDDQPVSE